MLRAVCTDRLVGADASYVVILLTVVTLTDAQCSIVLDCNQDLGVPYDVVLKPLG